MAGCTHPASDAPALPAGDAPGRVTGERAASLGPARRRVMAATLAFGLAGWGPGHGQEPGSEGMFGLFKGKKEGASKTIVHPAAGARLVRESAYPPTPPPASAASGRCTEIAVAGTPPAATRVEHDTPGETATGFLIEGYADLPPLLMLNGRDRGPRFDVWELGASAPLSFGRRRELRLDPAQSGWVGFRAVQVLCLPQQRQLVAISYAQPAARHGLYLHEARDGRFTRLAERIERDFWRPLPPSYIELLPAGADAALALYHSDAINLAGEVFVNTVDHLLLFSPRHPEGIEVLRLSVSEGNVRRGAVLGGKLWLETVDPRERGKPVTRCWSLDLTQVL